MDKLEITHSSMHCFMTCRKKYEWNYVKGYKPIETPHALSFGSAIHAGLEQWFVTHNEEAALAAITGLDEADMIKAEELVRAYTRLYADEPFTVKEIEYTFKVPVRHPDHRYIATRKALFTGRIDGLIERDGELWILEHKTATQAEEDYFLCKQFDNQIAFYALAIQDVFKRPVAGALYDVILKPQIKMAKGESDAEYEARKAASKTGKIKRKEAETAEQFRNRVADSIDDFNFMRRWIRFDRKKLSDKQLDFVKIARDMVGSGHIYQNTYACLSGYSPCEYRHLCAGCDEVKLKELYRKRQDMHEELSK